MSDDRERSFENALARHLRPDAQHAGCSDPETLAAYHEQSLAPEYMTSMQAHISDCPRCQQILAQLQATDEIPTPAVHLGQPKTAAVQRGVRIIPARKPTLWRWVAPAGALAAGLLVWVTVHESNLGRFAKAPSREDAKPTEIAKAQTSSTPPLPPPSLDATRRNESLSAEALRRSDTVQPSLSRITPSPQRSQSLAKQEDSQTALKKSAAAGVGGALAVASPKPASPPASQPSLQPEVPRSVSQTVEVTAEAQPANNELATTQAAAAGQATTQPKAKSEDNKRDTANSRAAESIPSTSGGAPAPSPPQVPSQSQSVQVMTESIEVSNLPVHNRQTANLANLNPGARALLAGTSPSVTVSAPGGRVSWRIGQAGVILFSSDSGKTWLVQPSGIITDLLSGSAPSAKVCWLVGRSGTILLTTDKGKHWRKVQPPTQDDFLSVFAVNARQATVSPASGTYQTTDRGATWNKLPPE
jgi:hypothetical protein